MVSTAAVWGQGQEKGTSGYQATRGGKLYSGLLDGKTKGLKWDKERLIKGKRRERESEREREERERKCEWKSERGRNIEAKGRRWKWINRKGAIEKEGKRYAKRENTLI